MKKKIVCIALALSIILGGCGASKATSTDTTGNASDNLAGTTVNTEATVENPDAAGNSTGTTVNS